MPLKSLARSVVCFPGLGISLILLSGVQVLQVELFLAQLAPGDLLIFRAGGHELRVSALAHQPAIVQHQDLIGVEDGGNALCHDDHSGIVSFFLQRTAQGDIRLVVKGREAVVEQIDLWILGNGTGDGEPLASGRRTRWSRPVQWGLHSPRALRR